MRASRLFLRTWLGMLVFLALASVPCSLRAESPEAITVIRVVTSDEVLRAVVKKHNLVAKLKATDEDSAVFRLRRRIYFFEDKEGKSLRVTVDGEDQAENKVLEKELSEIWASRAGKPQVYLENLEDDEALELHLRHQEDIVADRRGEVMRIMREKEVLDLSLMGSTSDVELKEAEAKLPEVYLRARRSWSQHLAVLNDDRDRVVVLEVYRKLQKSGKLPPKVFEVKTRTAPLPKTIQLHASDHSASPPPVAPSIPK